MIISLRGLTDVGNCPEGVRTSQAVSHALLVFPVLFVQDRLGGRLSRVRGAGTYTTLLLAQSSFIVYIISGILP